MLLGCHPVCVMFVVCVYLSRRVTVVRVGVVMGPRLLFCFNFDDGCCGRLQKHYACVVLGCSRLCEREKVVERPTAHVHPPLSLWVGLNTKFAAGCKFVYNSTRPLHHTTSNPFAMQ